MLTATNKNGTYRYTYDDLGRVKTQTDPFGLTLTYGYDTDGNVTSETDSLGGVVSSVYDSAGQLTSRLFSGPNGQQARLDLTYTPDGQVATLTRYSDLAGTNKVGFTQFSYDANGNEVQIQQQDGAGNVLDNRLYSYDSADRLISQTINGVQTSFGYDKDSQLVSAGTSTYSYDANGNRTMPGYVTGPNNQLLSDGTWNYSYDAVGNTIGKTNIQTKETWAYSYDHNNKLTLAVHKDAQGNLIETVALSYDVFGQLMEEDVYEASTNQTTVSKYAWDGQGNVWADLNSSGQLVMRRVYLDGPNQPVLRIDASGNVSWYLADHLGSIVGVTNASGSLIDQISYDAFGNITNETNPANGDNLKFQGMRWDAVLGLYLDGARDLNPQDNRFSTIDPSLFTAGDADLYRAFGNNPTNIVDPTGLAGWTPKKVWNLIGPVYQMKWWSLWQEGHWSVVTEEKEKHGDAKKSSAAWGRVNHDIDIDVTNKQGYRMLGKGRDVQWEDDKWLVDFGNRQIWIDRKVDANAAEDLKMIINRLTGKRVASKRGFDYAVDMYREENLTPSVKDREIIGFLVKEKKAWKDLSPREIRFLRALRTLDMAEGINTAKGVYDMFGVGIGKGKVAVEVLKAGVHYLQAKSADSENQAAKEALEKLEKQMKMK